MRGKSASNDTSPAASSTVGQNDKVIVATLNNRTTATAVVAVSPDGFGSRGPWGR